MSQQNNNISVESEIDSDPYALEWDKETYKLCYKGKEIGEGMMPAGIVLEFVRLMNCAYRNGYLEHKKLIYGKERTSIQTEFDFGDS